MFIFFLIEKVVIVIYGGEMFVVKRGVDFHNFRRWRLIVYNVRIFESRSITIIILKR